MRDFDVRTVPLEGTLLLEASAGTGKTWNLVRIA
jgi:ATP-dependent exoDNAse (exonuclease V) beta subunit